MSFIRCLILLTTMTFLFSCGNKNSGTNTPGGSVDPILSENSVKPEFIGKYRSSCIQNNSNASFLLTFELKSDVSTMTAHFMDNSASCLSDFSFETKTVLAVKFGSQTISTLNSEPVYPIDVTVSKLYFTIKDTSKAFEANTTKLCGISNWVVNQERDVTDTDCGVMKQSNGTSSRLRGSKLFTIANLSNDVLSLGNDNANNDGSTDTRRHNVLDRTRVFTRIR